MPRAKRGQSLVEYALGVCCVMAVCTLAVSFIGHVHGDSFQGRSSANKYNVQDGTKPGDQSPILRTANTPWVVN